MSKLTKEQILQSAKENHVEFVRLQFTDLFGIMKNVAITVSQLEKALDNECMFDGSSINGFVRIDESDMYLHPDYDSWAIVPWRKHEEIQTGRSLMTVASLRYQLFFPVLVLVIITVSFYIIGNAFADAADPKNHVK